MILEWEKMIYDVGRGFFTALGALAELFAFILIFDFNIHLSFIVVVVAVSLLIYLFDFYEETEEDLESKNKHYMIYQKIIFSFFIAFLFAVYLYTMYRYGSPPALYFSLALVVLGLLYDSFFKKITQKIVGFKDFFVTAIWNSMLIVFMLFHGQTFSLPIIIFLIFVFTRDFVNITFCDLKDVAHDKKENLQTFAEHFGKKRTIQLLQIVNVASALLLAICVILEIFPPIAIGLLIPIATTIAILKYSWKNKNFSPYLVDSEYFIWFLSVAFIKLVA